MAAGTTRHSNMAWGRGTSRKAVPTRTCSILIIVVLLQFLLTFAQGQGQGEAAVPPVDERVEFTIEEELPAGTLVGTIPTRDGLTYRFSEEPNLFVLDGTSGDITTTTQIDRESLPSDSFDLFIQSVPTARHLIEVHIEVLDVNDNFPEFGRSNIQIFFSENDQPATQVILDTAMDGDIGQNDVTTNYEIVSGNEEGRFELVPLTDTSIPLLYLQNRMQLDREERDNYQLVISAQDGGNPPRFGFLTVNINITDTNDNPPLFDQSDYSTTVNETIPVHTSIIQVHATDRDIGRNADIRYRIVNDDYSQFDVDERTGIVRTLRQLYCEQSCSREEQEADTCHPSSCVVVVEASDDGQPSPLTGRAYITVSLIDENDHNPVIIIRYIPSSAPYATVDEGANVGNVVAIVSVTDHDTGANGDTTLTVVQGNEEGHFTLDTSTGINMIRVAGQLDRERVSKYNLTLRAVDHGEPQRSSTAFLIIRVNDINDHMPVFQESSYSATLGELTPLGSFVASITATDDDTGINAQVSYAIVSGDDRGWFQIDPNTGLLTTKAVLDHEVLTNLVLMVRAQDGAANPYRSYTNVTITILDENDMAPTFAQSTFELNLPEGTPAGTTVITTTAIDNDQGLNGTVRYAFDPEVTANYPGMFQLNSITGRIVTQIDLDREVYSHFHLKVRATDQGTPALSSTATVNINVTDLNDNDPIFYPVYYYASILENQPGFTSVIQVTATDRDFGENATIHFSITAGANEKFVIDITSGWITTVEQLDREERDSYTLTIRAQDMGGRLAPTPAIVQVTVNDLQDSLPTFTSSQGYTFAIVEDDSRVTAQVGRLVGQVRATSQDTSSDITYEITAGDPNGLFTINRNNGVISTAQVVDREQGPFYSLTIVARAGSLFGETMANITIQDVNDNPPSFPVASAESFVVENWPVGHDVFLAEAHDPDHGNNASLTYTITHSSSNMFTIDSTTGLLHLAQAIHPGGDTEFTLTVRAADGGSPSQTATMDITITVFDYNDNTPQFEQTTYEVSILESQPVNNHFYQVTATDEDTGVNGDVLYSIESGNEGDKFGIFPDGVLYIAHELDRETKDLYILTIKAVDMAVEPRSSHANITIHILDANDNRPVFTNHTYQFNIPENSEIDTFVGFVTATDIDLAQNGEIIYRIEGEDTGFDIHPTSGAIVTTSSFDREALMANTGLDIISLVIIASDSGTTRLTDRAVVNVHIRDMNDNAPVFISESYDPSLYENAEINTQVVKVSATDTDIGVNGQITYSIADGNIGDVFSIDELTGQMTLVKTLDRETTASYVLDVMASDAGTPPMTTIVKVYVTILDNNDNAPVFSVPGPTADIIETSLPQTYITQVTATDADVGNNALITYSITAGNDRDAFHIEGSTGKLYLANNLDYEWKQQFTLTITATDFGSPELSSTSTCTINVLDFNDNRPYFSSSPMVRQIDEGADIGTSILTIQASDPDSGINGQLQYDIVNQVPSGNHFTIDSTTGLITTAAEIDREFVDNFQITVRATDMALPVSARKSAEKMVTVMVLDVNDNSPRFTSMNAVPVLQTVSPNTRLMTVTATDADDGNNGRVQYSITGDTSRFRIDANSGALILTSSLSSQIQTYDLNIEARDMATTNQRSTTSKLTVFLRASVENGPSFTQASYSGQVYENEPAGTSILTVSAYSSNGAGNSVEYYITGITADGVPQPHYFQVNPTTGVLSTWEELDREKGASVFRVEVYAVDTSATAPLTRTTQVTITLLDRNDSPPEFSAGMFNEVEVPENTNPGYILMQIIATDADEEGTVTYAITSGNEAGKFAIDPVQGELQIIQPLDREVQAFYDLEITANDGSQSSSKVIKVIVTDINDQEPLFTQPWYYFDIAEDAIMGTTIGQVVAIDADSPENGGVTYSVISDWGRAKFTLSPHSGVFTLSSALDFEQTQHYILTIQAEDSGFQPLSSTVTVYMNVIDVNDNAPEFDPGSYSNEVWENATVGTSILVVTATDIDAELNAEVRYSITGGDPLGKFTVDEMTGEVRTAKLLDREEQGYYNLAITAQDQGLPESARLESVAMVSIILEDNNDNPPLFTSPSKVVVSEDASAGTSVFQVKAEDLDEGRNGYIEFQLHPADTAMFSIGPVDGIVRIRSATLDRESSDTYELRVIATDKGVPPQSSTMTLTIIVGDVNDNSPVFNPRTYDATLPESVVIGSYVLTVTATDRDISINADIRYLISSGNENQDFRLDSHTGELYINNGLDYERNVEYSITVTVQDLGELHLSDTATIHITVTDLNDNAPVFLDAPYIAYVQENTPPSQVTTISAVDYDSASFANTKYSIVDGDSTFLIDQNTGVITSTRQLDREERSQYQLHVKAMDGTSSRLSSTARVTILVQDENDNTPHFIKPNSLSIATVMENAPPSTLIFQAYATDEDTGINAEISYELQESSNGKFAIHRTTGAITTTISLDREEQETHNLVVKATDGGLLARYATVPLVVTVEDINDKQPIFPLPKYTKYIRDPTSAGDYVLGVTALDADIGMNGEIDYSIFGGGETNFQIDSSTGVITARRTITNIQSVYTFYVRATDKGANLLSDEATVEVHVLPSGTTNFPTFVPSQNQFTLPETLPVGNILTTVSATTPRQGRSISYHMAGGNVGQAFAISQSSGVITINKPLDYESTQSYHQLWVEARDNGNPQLSEYLGLDVMVEDRNDNAPVFSSTLYNVTVMEEEYPPISVLIVAATDADSDDNGRVTYAITGGNEGTPFLIDNTEGRIRTNMKLDRETLDHYLLQVEAIDHGSPSRTATAVVDVTVIDKNDEPPVFTQHFHTHITENAPIGTFVLKITSTDRDIGENSAHTYAFTQNPDNKFAIDSESGEIIVAGELDFEHKDEYILWVSANDQAYNIGTTVSIYIDDANDNAPIFSAPSYSFSVLEQQPVDSSVGQISATDMDSEGPNSQVFYVFKTSTSWFHLDSESGEIFNRDILMYQTAGSGPSPENIHHLTVQAIDRGSPVMSSEVAVTITIEPANQDAIYFVEDSYWAPIAEDVATGTSVVHLEAGVVGNPTAAMSYSENGGNGTSFFLLNENTGLISVAQSLSGQSGKVFTFVVRAQQYNSMSGMSASITVVIQVAEVNRFSPQFVTIGASYQTTVAENQALGTIIASVNATDADSGRNGLVSFFLVDGNEQGLFSMDESQGYLRVVQPLDYELTTSHRLTIAAIDRGLIPRETRKIFTVYVTDVNDNAPLFASQHLDAYFMENSPSGSLVYQAYAADADRSPNNQVVYSMTGPTATMSKFIIEPATGAISSQGQIDYEQVQEYEVVLTAMNPGTTLSSTATLAIHIEGRNEFVPHFSQASYQFAVSESDTTGFSIGSVQATDMDHGEDGHVYYYLIGDSNMQGFTMDLHTGAIRVDRQIDRESSSEIILDVLAKNSGPIRGNDTSRCIVTVLVRDANDPPYFSATVYEGHVLENAPIGSSIIQVSALDSDLEDEFRSFTYSLLSGNDVDAFSIDPTSGLITKQGALDRESSPILNLTVAAIDSGVPPQTGTTMVRVIVDDVNDNGPYLEPALPTAPFVENTEPDMQTIFNLVPFVHDRDLPPNQGPYTYRLLNHTSQFAIGLTSGLLKPKVLLDRETQSEYYLRLEVSDNGSPTMSSPLVMKVEVEDMNDNPSTQRPLTVMVYVFEEHLPGATIANVRPLDPDLIGTYQCQLVGGDRSMFSIASGCELKAGFLYSEQRYNLNVSGSDGIHSQVYSAVSVQLHSFDQALADHSIQVKVSVSSVSVFLQHYYTSFLDAVQQFIPTGFSLVLYAMSDTSPHVSVFMAAPGSGEGVFMSRNALMLNLQSNRAAIEAAADLTLATINYNPCQVNPCQNDAECSSAFRAFEDDIMVVDSPSLVFAGARVEQHVECGCPEEFTGNYCEIPISNCNAEPCQHGGTCVLQTDGSSACQCPTNWRGDLCEEDVNECLASPCRNGGTCLNRFGSYECDCTPQFTGDNCERGVNFCESHPCGHGGTCSPQQSGFTCACPFGTYGLTCQIQSAGFAPLSYMEFDPLWHQQNNTIIIEFATNNDGLLLFSGNANEFVAIEIVDSKVRFGFSLGEVMKRLTVDRSVTNGTWYRVEATRHLREASLRVLSCPEGETRCHPCITGDSSCYAYANAAQPSQHELLNLGQALVSIAGVRNFMTVQNNINRLSTHDFVGCIRHIRLDGADLLSTTPSASQGVTESCPRTSTTSLCLADPCDNGGSCVDQWDTYICLCPLGFSGTHCEEEAIPFVFAPNALVTYEPRQSYVRDQMLANSAGRRRRRQAQSSSRVISMSIRVTNASALLFYTTASPEYTALQIRTGKLEYVSRVQGESQLFRLLHADQAVNDGKWHDVTLTVAGKAVSIDIDGSENTEIFEINLPDPLDLSITAMYLGGSKEEVTLGSPNPVPGFEGCLENFAIDGDALPFDGMTERFEAVAVGGSTEECAAFLGVSDTGASGGNEPLGIPEEVIAVVVVFFVVLVVGILVGLGVRYRRKWTGPKLAKGTNNLMAVKSNGTMHDKAADSRSHQDSGYTENGDVPEELIIRQHIQDELATHAFNEREITDQRLPARPDIIAPEAAQVHMGPEANLLLDGSAGDNIGYIEEPPEHYDIDNASSIAPSDLVDVVGHYKRYRAGMMGQNKYKNTTNYLNNLHPHRYSPGPLQSQPLHESPHGAMRASPASMLSHRESPNMMVMQNSQLSRQSPAPRIQPSPLTINNVNNLSRTSPMPHQQRPLSPLNQLNRQSPAGMVAKRQSPLPIGSLRSTPVSGLYPSNASTSSYSERPNIPNGHMASRPNSRMKQPINQLAMRGTPTRGLTVEDVERLNARPKSTLPGTHDAFSSSSEAPSRNILARGNLPPPGSYDPTLEPPESSSDDGSNDSFTCSEFEYDNDKVRNDFQPNRLLFPKLPETENENEDTDASRTFTYDGSGSTRDRDSLSTFFNSDDELPKPSNKLLNGALNLDYFLSWGPNFEKLVGVFTDIAELPDADLKTQKRPSSTQPDVITEESNAREEYV